MGVSFTVDKMNPNSPCENITQKVNVCPLLEAIAVYLNEQALHSYNRVYQITRRMLQ